MIHYVLLSGGSGTRLWPLSNGSRSKQFLKVLRDASGAHVSMVQRTIANISKIAVPHDVTIATCAEQCESIESQVGAEHHVVIEPERRDTAAAILLATANLSLEQHAADEDTVIVMPIDAYAGREFYDATVRMDEAVREGAADLVLMGAEPTFPSEKYGYVVPESREGSVWPVAEFREKPRKRLAQALLERGALWNCGVFAFKLGWMSGIRERYLSCEAFDAYIENYRSFPKISFDYEVVEHATSVAVVPFSGEWKDLGTWNALTEEMAEPVAGRAVVDGVTCAGTHVINETGLPLVVTGIRDSVVVVAPDGVLVSGKQESSTMKELVERAAESRPMFEKHIWGRRRMLDARGRENEGESTVSKLVVLGGACIPTATCNADFLQWTVTRGHGQALVNGKAFDLHPGTTVTVGRGEAYSCTAHERLHIVEVLLED